MESQLDPKPQRDNAGERWRHQRFNEVGADSIAAKMACQRAFGSGAEVVDLANVPIYMNAAGRGSSKAATLSIHILSFM
jgi:hypothetical protein